MQACRHCWAAYVECMERSRHAHDPICRKLYIQDAYAWLDRYDLAVERETRARLGAAYSD